MKRRLITFSRIVRMGLINFVRNATLAMAAMAVMVVTLTIILFSIVANATFVNTIQQITNKIDVSVYLKDSVTQNQANQLVSQLKHQPNVKGVEYLNKDQALKRFLQESAGQQQEQALITGTTETGNPIPATILVKPYDLNKLDTLKTFLSEPKNASLQVHEASYSGDLKTAIDNITRATDVLREAGIVAVIVFALISTLIIFNTIRMAIFNRRDELTIMRLLGASNWFIRGPFVVESVVYGIISASISVFLIDVLFVGSANALQASSLGLLDIGYASSFFKSHMWWLLTLQLAIGILIGAASSIIATRRYLKFKSK